MSFFVYNLFFSFYFLGNFKWIFINVRIEYVLNLFRSWEDRLEGKSFCCKSFMR